MACTGCQKRREAIVKVAKSVGAVMIGRKVVDGKVVSAK
jgi:hypothetical protein